MKFAITILIVLGIASIGGIILGELFPADVPGGEGFYFGKLGAAKFRLFRSLGFFNPYHSFWYISLLAILSFSLIVCTLKHVRSIWRTAFGKGFKTSPQDILSLQNSKRVQSAAAGQKVSQTLESLLKKKFYKIDLDQREGKTFIFAHRGGVARLGALLIHFGLVTTVLGGLIASLFGYSVYRWGGEGDVLSVPERDFQVRVDNFEILTNPKDEIKDYLCTLTVLEKGKELFTKVIEVNRPLRHQGISFYQSSYRPNPRAVKKGTINVRDLKANRIVGRISLEKDDIVPIAGTKYSLQMADFAGNFMMRGREVYSVPGYTEFYNPAVKLNVYNNGQLSKSGWVFTPQLAGVHSFLQDYGFELVGFEKVFETGLKVTKNPGASWIWIGLVLMTLGVSLAFYITHRRIWAIVNPVDGTRTSVTLGGVANKNKLGFEKEIEEIIVQISKEYHYGNICH